MWKLISRSKTIFELLAALVVVTPVILASSKLIQQGLAAMVPAWVVLLPAAVALILAFVLWRQANPKTIQGRHHRPLQRIEFDYADSPANHGWKVEGDKDGSPTFKRILDGHVGSALQIRSTTKMKTELVVDPAATLGTIVEFMVKLETEYRMYTLVRVQSKDAGKSKDLWLSYRVGTEPPKRLDVTWWEYQVPVTPAIQDGNWLSIRIDLVEAVRRTAGVDGWKFGQLKIIRFRGNLSLAHIAIMD